MKGECEGRVCKCVCGGGFVYLDPVVVALQFILKMLVLLLKVLHPRQVMTKIVASHQQPLLPIRGACVVYSSC